jgi:hypothetical protein
MTKISSFKVLGCKYAENWNILIHGMMKLVYLIFGHDFYVTLFIIKPVVVKTPEISWIMFFRGSQNTIIMIETFTDDA